MPCTIDHCSPEPFLTIRRISWWSLTDETAKVFDKLLNEKNKYILQCTVCALYSKIFVHSVS